jgi:RNA polymerase sigma-70 factor (ECF subfamily)
MTSSLAPPAASPSPADPFEGERARLQGLAYRITGSQATAEDLVQETWIRWQAADQAEIERPEAWLTTVTSRLALDHLRSARHQREAYVGPWLPEVVDAAPGPTEHLEVAESLTVGFLAVLERLDPVERVVFVLADVFGVPHAEISRAVGRSPEACRQVASRARRRVRAERPRYQPTDQEAWDVALAFLGAAAEGDLDGLLALLAPGAVSISDGGPDHRAARRPVVRARIPRFVANLVARQPADASVDLRTINGQPGVLVRTPSGPYAAIVLAVGDGAVERIWIVRNPDKLRALDQPAG